MAEPASVEERRFGRYRVTSTLGAGAMGEVYLAIDDVLGREVAIKTLRAGVSGLGARILDERFRQEARAIASLAHPSVVQVFDLDATADPPYLVMERVAGPSLKERLAQGPLTVDAARGLGIQIANALAAAHAAGIVHRDVKPANILIAGPGSWKLADFGVAHIPDSSLTITGQFMGSPAYAPPEALVRGIASAAGDIYGLGATLYQAIAGSWPRLDATTSGLLAPTPPLRDLAPSVPYELAAAIDRAVAIEAEHRPTAAQFAEALASRPSQEMTSPPAVSAATLSAVARSPGSLRPFVIGGAIVVALVVVAVLATRHTSHEIAAGSSAATSSPELPTTPVANPGEIIVKPPQRAQTEPEANHDWNEIVKKLQDGKVGEAQRRLDEWESDYGSSPETADLKRQLAAIPQQSWTPGRRGKRGKHDD